MSSESWQVGDIALCIRDDWRCACGKDHHPEANPKNGQYLTVSKVVSVRGHLFLVFKDNLQDIGWDHSAFRKVKPDNEPAADEEWVQQLQRFRRKEVA